MFAAHYNQTGKAHALFAALAVACVMIEGRSAQAQKAPAAPPLPAIFQQPYSGEAKGMTFTAITALFGQVTGISIVADGEPVLAKSDFRFSGTVKQTLHQIADTFDFDWTVTKSGIVLMTKRFTSPNDRPQVSLIETRQIIRDMSRTFQAVPFSTELNFMPRQMQAIYNTLTPVQIQALRGGQELPAAQLFPNAFDMVKESILNNNFGGPLQEWNRLSERLDKLPASFLQAQERRSPGSDPSHWYDVMWISRSKNEALQGESFAIMPIADKDAEQNITGAQP